MDVLARAGGEVSNLVFLPTRLAIQEAAETILIARKRLAVEMAIQRRPILPPFKHDERIRVVHVMQDVESNAAGDLPFARD